MSALDPAHMPVGHPHLCRDLSLTGLRPEPFPCIGYRLAGFGCTLGAGCGDSIINRDVADMALAVQDRYAPYEQFL